MQEQEGQVGHLVCDGRGQGSTHTPPLPHLSPDGASIFPRFLLTLVGSTPMHCPRGSVHSCTLTLSHVDTPQVPLPTAPSPRPLHPEPLCQGQEVTCGGLGSLKTLSLWPDRHSAQPSGLTSLPPRSSQAGFCAPFCPSGSEAAEGLAQEEGRSGLAGAELKGPEQGGLETVEGLRWTN